MAGPNTNLYGDISPRTASYAAKKLLERGMYLLITERFAQVKPLPARSSRTIKFRRYLELDTTPVPLAEGVTPPGKKLTYEDIQATVEQYGDWMELTDVIMDTHEDPVLNEMMSLLGEQAPEILEKVRIEVLKGGTNVYYEGGAARTDVDLPVSVSKLRQIVRDFRDNKAKFYTSIVKASTGIATEPVGPSFFALCHTDLDHDLRSLNTSGDEPFVPVEKYSDSMAAIPGELGKIENIRFVGTPLMTPWVGAGAAGTTTYQNNGANYDVFPIVIMAPNSWAVVPLKGKTAITPKVLNPGVPRGGDPLGQIGSVGWKTWSTGVILQDLWLARYEVASRLIT